MDIKEESRPPPAYNYAKTNWKEFHNILKGYIPIPISPNATKQDIDQHAENIVDAITKTIHETTPRKRPCPYSKR